MNEHQVDTYATPAEHEVKAEHAVLRATIQVTRAATGKVEEYEIVGTPITT